MKKKISLRVIRRISFYYEALLKLNDTHGRELALAALSRLGVKSAKELAPEQYRKAIDLFVLATENGSV